LELFGLGRLNMYFQSFFSEDLKLYSFSFSAPILGRYHHCILYSEIHCHESVYGFVLFILPGYIGLLESENSSFSVFLEIS
jgi:hypothetical protein